MENIENQDPDAINKHDQAKIDELKDQANYRVKCKKEMMANESMQKYFEGFSPSSINSFIDIYTRRKVSWKEYGPNWRKTKEEEEEQWMVAAFEHLGNIQQKKLFDLQCIWRADQIKIPGIEICWDFRMWENENILACPFIDPITEAEIDLYHSYLSQNNRDENKYNYMEWQDYDRIKRTLKDEADAINALPEWYQFYNSRTGKGILLQLPDIRGEKEKFYSTLWYDSIRAKSDALPVTKVESRPFLNYGDDDLIKWFVGTFENKEVQNWYRDYNYGHDYNDAYDDVDEHVRFLLATGETIPIEGNKDWVKALEQAVQNYKTAKVSEALWDAWDQYQITIQSGLGFSLEENSHVDIRNMLAEHILAGRKLNGEPEDFDF